MQPSDERKINYRENFLKGFFYNCNKVSAYYGLGGKDEGVMNREEFVK